CRRDKVVVAGAFGHEPAQLLVGLHLAPTRLDLVPPLAGLPVVRLVGVPFEPAVACRDQVECQIALALTAERHRDDPVLAKLRDRPPTPPRPRRERAARGRRASPRPSPA